MRTLLITIALLCAFGCAGASCEEWTTKEVVDYNFCRGEAGAPEPGLIRRPDDSSNCVAWGTRERLECTKRPDVSGEPVNR